MWRLSLRDQIYLWQCIHGLFGDACVQKHDMHTNSPRKTRRDDTPRRRVCSLFQTRSMYLLYSFAFMRKHTVCPPKNTIYNIYIHIFGFVACCCDIPYRRPTYLLQAEGARKVRRLGHGLRRHGDCRSRKCKFDQVVSCLSLSLSLSYILKKMTFWLLQNVQHAEVKCRGMSFDDAVEKCPLPVTNGDSVGFYCETKVVLKLGVVSQPPRCVPIWCTIFSLPILYMS